GELGQQRRIDTAGSDSIDPDVMPRIQTMHRNAAGHGDDATLGRCISRDAPDPLDSPDRCDVYDGSAILSCHLRNDRYAVKCGPAQHDIDLKPQIFVIQLLDVSGTYQTRIVH